MDNLDKAKTISLVAATVQDHKRKIGLIKSFYESWSEVESEGKRSNVDLMIGFSSREGAYVEPNADIFDFLILQEEGRLDKAEQELDKLLNGDVNKLKGYLTEDCINKILKGEEDGQENSRTD